MKWLILYYDKHDRYTRCFQPFETKEKAIKWKNEHQDYNIIDIVELTKPLYL